MAPKNKENPEFEALKESLAAGSLKKLYFFYGAERFMLDHYLSNIKKKLVGGDFTDFNYHRFNSSSFDFDELAAACEALPVFSERTMVEVHDIDLLKANADMRERVAALTADLPEEVCLIFVSLAEKFEKEDLPKLKKALGKNACFVSFDIQETSKLVKWIRKHFSELGKSIDAATAEYLSFITGGHMTTLKSEIDKLSLYVSGDTVTRADIDKLVIPDLDAQSYIMTDHIITERFDSAAAVLSDLLSMQEPPHKLIYAISSKLRQLMLARVLYENGQDIKLLMKTADIRFEFQARNLMSAARNIPLWRCRRYVLLGTEAAYRMNTGSDPEIHLTDLFIRLADTARRRTDA